MTAPNQEKFGILSAIGDVEFSACVTAAGNLNKAARGALQDDSLPTETFYPMGLRTMPGIDLRVKGLGRTVEFGGDEYEIALAQPMAPTKSKRSKDQKSVTLAPLGYPLIIARNEDLYLPIGSLDNRPDRKCGLAQLGHEMELDDYAIPPDEAADGTRMKIFRTLTGYIKNAASGDTSVKTKASQEINDLATSERDRNKRYYEESRESLLVRRSIDSHRFGITQSLEVINEDLEAFQARQVTGTKLIRGVHLDSGRTVDLFLGHSNTGGNNVTLFAVTRDSIALPLVQMNALTSELEFVSNNDTLDVDARHDAVTLAHDIITKKQPTVEFSMDNPATRDEVILGIALEQCGFLNMKGLSQEYTQNALARLSGTYKTVLSAILTDNTESTSYWLSHLTEMASVNFISHPVDNASTSDPVALCTALQVDERFADIIGRTTIAEEKLIGRLLVMASTGREFKMLLKDVAYHGGQDRSDTEIKGFVQRQQGHLLETTLTMWPTAQINEPPTNILTGTFDTHKPLLGPVDVCSDESRTRRNQYAGDILEVVDKLIEVVVSVPKGIHL